MRGFLFLFLLFNSYYAYGNSSQSFQDIIQELRKNFPRLEIDNVTYSPIKCLYEVHSGRRVFYVDKDLKHLVIGSILDTKGQNLTLLEERKLYKEFTDELIKTFPVDKSVYFKGGTKPSVFLIVDADCPFSRAVLSFLLQKNVGFHAIFLQAHKDSFYHTLYILASKDKKKVLREIISGKYDGKGLSLIKPIPYVERKKYEELLKFWDKWAHNHNINKVPIIIVPDKKLLLEGADITRLQKLYPISFSHVDLEKAPIILGKGSGLKAIVVLDPTCPFCKRIFPILVSYAKEGKATFYIFFLPVHGNLSMRYLADIMNANKETRIKILQEFFEGKRKPSSNNFTSSARKEFEEQLQVVKELGVTSDPTIIFEDNERVIGADINKLEKKFKNQKIISQSLM